LQYDFNVRFRVEEFVTDVHSRVVGQRSRKVGRSFTDALIGATEAKSATEESEKVESEEQRSQHDSSIETSTYENTIGVVSERPLSATTGDCLSLVRTNSASTTPILREPVWTEAQIDPLDGKYFHFFLSQVNSIIAYGDLFPNFVRSILPRTLQSKPLLHSIMAVSSALTDDYLKRPMIRALQHKQRAIISLQQGLASGDITEEIAISIFIFLNMDAFDFFASATVPQNHLRGFGLVLKELQLDWDDPEVWNRVSPALMLVWRIAIRLDTGVAVTHRTLPVLPTFPAATNALHRTWASRLANDGRSADLAVASFALDNLAHRSISWIMEGDVFRASAEYVNDAKVRDAYDTLFQQRVALLRQEHADWLQLPVCSLGMQSELLAQTHEIPPDAPTFLEYPPLNIHDCKFSHLLNQWRSIGLSFSILSFRDRNPLQRCLSDINRAVEICRTNAAMALSPSSPDFAPEVFSLISAGYVFGGGRKREFAWVYERISEMVAMKPQALAGLRIFFDRVKAVHMTLPEWVAVDDVNE
jgi:Fungal specific transcription factor domain